MYAKSEVTRYSGKEPLDLMGPVETGYCDIEIIEENGCEKLLRVIPSADLDDYRERLGWQLTPADPGECSDRDGSGVIGAGPAPGDECFDEISNV
jgi:hypothetical protein